jgi:hypothetical protein
VRDPKPSGSRDATLPPPTEPPASAPSPAGDPDSPKARFRAEFTFRPELTGVVMVHGIGPHLAGQTLLEWVRPVITLMSDACAADPALEQVSVDDPVFRSSIDFSGETFPVVQLRIPRRTDVPPADPRGQERRWIVTEAWWASEVRPPTLQTMAEWLGEQGGVSRIVQGIQENALGRGRASQLAAGAVRAFVSVVVSFVLLVFAVLLGISRLIPFGPLREAVGLRLASTFLTDWFGGARTLLRDPAQSANVRGRLVATIKALRAYGCRDVVLVAHSGGTMVSLTTLTDPAYPRVRAEKLITIGEAVNLGWRLEDERPGTPPPTPPIGNRMRADLALTRPHLQWRDFWASHDPAPAGRPVLPRGSHDPGPDRFTAERVYNRLSIAGDHGGYWENDEQFLVPLIREIDVPTGDRSRSRFYSDAFEAFIRERRKERLTFLTLWRRATLALPLLAIFAAAMLTGGGMVHEAGDALLGALNGVPGFDLLQSTGRWLAERGNAPILSVDWLPRWTELVTWAGLYQAGLLVIQALFLLLLATLVVPSRIDRFWRGQPGPVLVMRLLDIALGIVPFLLIVVLALLTGSDAIRSWLLGTAVLLAIGGVLAGLGLFGDAVRSRIRELRPRHGLGDRFVRDALITASGVFLGLVVLLLGGAVFAVVLVFAGNDAVPAAGDTRRFIVGALVVLLAFSLLGRIGGWRWDAWDGRERRLLRRSLTPRTQRVWVLAVATALTVVAAIGALIVALGTPGASLPLLERPAWVAVLVVAVLLIVVVSLGKDVVDNDTQAARHVGGAGTGGEPAPVEPMPSGPAAGTTGS